MLPAPAHQLAQPPDVEAFDERGRVAERFVHQVESFRGRIAITRTIVLRFVMQAW